MSSLQTVINEVNNNLVQRNEEFKRLFHGRGGCFEGFEFLTIDSIDTLLLVCFFQEPNLEQEEAILDFCKQVCQEFDYVTLVLQRRYLKQVPNEVILGSLPQESVAKEAGLSYGLNLKDNQNIGFFADMKNGRHFVSLHAKNKRVLNLFSYTCSFSVVAMKYGASKVVNVDMSKSALTKGRANHHLNGLNTKSVEFMPYNILKSWSRIKKSGPYDLVIIDPPSFQKGSFAITKDYDKIVKRLSDLCAKEAYVLACINDPMLCADYLKELFFKEASGFEFVEQLKNCETFKSVKEKSSLKCLVFHKQH